MRDRGVATLTNLDQLSLSTGPVEQYFNDTRLGHATALGEPIPVEAFENNSLLIEEHHARLLKTHGPKRRCASVTNQEVLERSCLSPEMQRAKSNSVEREKAVAGEDRTDIPMTRPQRYCIFCNRPGLTRTHIWPEWLHQLIQPGAHTLEEVSHEGDDPSAYRSRTLQGSIFRQRPKLCCAKCNGGWMARFENEMVKFAKPLFTSWETRAVLNPHQQRVLAVWITLICVLAEFIDHRNRITTPEAERKFIKARRVPPDTWAIVACSSNSELWRAKYRHIPLDLRDFSSIHEYFGEMASRRVNNTQITTLGMGRLYVQVFRCLNLALLSDYMRNAKASDFVQNLALHHWLLALVQTSSEISDENHPR